MERFSCINKTNASGGFSLHSSEMLVSIPRNLFPFDSEKAKNVTFSNIRNSMYDVLKVSPPTFVLFMCEATNVST